MGKVEGLMRGLMLWDRRVEVTARNEEGGEEEVLRMKIRP
jgi:hypothetical protein